MKLNVNVFFKAFDFDANRVGVDVVGFDLILIVLGMMRVVVAELMDDTVASVGFGSKAFPF